MKAYSLKYWENSGILPIEGELQDNGRFMFTGAGGWFQSLSKNEFALTLEEARGKVESLRNKKIVTLVKQLDKIKKLRVEVNEV